LLVDVDGVESAHLTLLVRGSRVGHGEDVGTVCGADDRGLA
jgi:hypothetical protein